MTAGVAREEASGPERATWRGRMRTRGKKEMTTAQTPKTRILLTNTEMTVPAG